MPDAVMEALLPISTDDEAVKDYGVELGIGMCKTLTEGGAPGGQFIFFSQERCSAYQLFVLFLFSPVIICTTD